MTDGAQAAKGAAAKIFREVEVLMGLLIKPEEKRWLEKPVQRPQPAATLLYLGCNVLRTPHMAQTVTGIFQRLGEDFVALGGPAFCCGLPFDNAGASAEARGWGERLASQFSRFHPQEVVVWCPGCFHFYRNALGLSGPFRLSHVSEFLAERRNTLPFAPQPATKVALHYHSDSPDAEGQAAAARALLGAAPGLEVLEIGSSEAFGRNCSGIARDKMGRETWEALLMSFFKKAVELRADVFATLYHGCHRMHALYQGRFPFPIEHYLTVVGRTLGIEYPDKYKQYYLWRDRDRIIEDARPCLEANGIGLDLAVPLVERVFVEGNGF